MRDILPEIKAWMEQGEQVALATVIQTWGSAPRKVGANMATTLSGKIAGSVSGGCVEGAVVQAGLETLKSDRSQLLHFGVADETAWQVGLACGGTIEVYIRVLRRATFESIDFALNTSTPGVYLFGVRGPQDLLDREWVFTREQKLFGDFENDPDGKFVEAGTQALIHRRSERSTVKIGEQTIEVFGEYMASPPVLVMVGGVHIALALASIARTMGFQTVIVDPRRAFGSTERFANADQLIQAWPEEAFGQIHLSEDSAIVVLSHDPKIDDPALKLAFKSPAFYIGALGSRGTQAKRKARLHEAGITDSQLSRLHAPIGLQIGAETPEEIALSIMAELIAERHPAPETGPAPVHGIAATI